MNLEQKLKEIKFEFGNPKHIEIQKAVGTYYILQGKIDCINKEIKEILPELKEEFKQVKQLINNLIR